MSAERKRAALDPFYRTQLITDMPPFFDAYALGIGELCEVDQRERMDLDVVTDDELHPREADAVIRDEAEREGLLGIGEIYHHLRARLGEGLQVRALHFKGQLSFVNKASIAFRTAYGDKHAVL